MLFQNIFGLHGHRKLKVILLYLLLVNVLILFSYHQLSKTIREGMKRKNNLEKDTIPNPLQKPLLGSKNPYELRINNNSVRDINYSKKPEKNNRTNKKILLWNSFFKTKTMMLQRTGTYHFERYCEVKECTVITHDDNIYPLEEIDALVYHAWARDVSLPTVRSPHTQYVFFLLESPDTLHEIVKLSSSRFNNKFNLTMTYRNDADFPIPYGQYVKRKKPITLPNLDMKIRYKNKIAAWMSSKCDSTGERHRIVEALKKYFPVDVFGKCGNDTCPRDKWKYCVDNIERQYKFYLSFENSVCKDYVTEKLFMYGRRYIIPVVYGGADYAKIAPPKSYINVKDFQNVTHLSNYLLYLNKNDTAYKEYFKWHENFEIKINPSFNKAWCDLCAKLHQPKRKTYTNFGAWFDKCENPKKFLSKFLV